MRCSNVQKKWIFREYCKFLYKIEVKQWTTMNLVVLGIFFFNLYIEIFKCVTNKELVFVPTYK